MVHFVLIEAERLAVPGPDLGLVIGLLINREGSGLGGFLILSA